MDDILARVDDAWRRCGSDRDALERELLAIRADVAAEYGTESAAYVTMCNELGTFYRVTANYKKGEAVFFEALAGIEAIAGRHDQYATCMDNLAELYRLDGRLDECEATVREAEGYFTDEHSLEYAACINYQGHLACARHDFERGLALYTKALGIVEENGSPAFHASTAYANIANVLQTLGRLDEAAAYLARARAIYDAGELSKGAHYIALLNSLALLHEQMHDDAQAKQVFDAEIDDMARVPTSPIDALVSLVNAGRFYARTKDVAGLRAVLGFVDRLAALDRIQGHQVLVRTLEEAKAWRELV